MANDHLGLPSDGSRPGSPTVHKMPSSDSMRREDEGAIAFDSPQEEAAHYREKYRRILDMLDETRAELDEFQASSKELEDELEKELAATEKQQMDLKEKIKRLEGEKEDWRNKHIALQKMHSSSTGAMQREMDNLRSERDKTLVALRDLEMGNDELERNERVAVSSLLDLESKYNRAIEEKTLLEQEIVSRDELEVETQRLRDEIRDANNEISMLREREQQFRGVPTPPSSVSAPRSPVHVSTSPPTVDVQPQEDDDRFTADPGQKPLPRSPMPRSATSSSIPALASPTIRRSNTGMVRSPSGLPSLARSTNTRNLAGAAGPASPSPFNRTTTTSKLPAASPVRVVSSNSAKSKGFKLLHQLQAKMKSTDDKLERTVPKRNVSNPMPLVPTKRTTPGMTSSSTMSSLTARAPHARVQALAGDVTTPSVNEKSSILSPNGWIMVDDEDTPLAQLGRSNRPEPDSPLDPAYRAASQASQASQTSQKSTSSRLPARPGIPSPLASVNGLNKSTSRIPQRTPSRAGTTPLHQSTRPQSRAEEGHRPMSPSMIPRPSSSMMHTFSGADHNIHTITASSSTPTSRPDSRSAHRVLGRGPPPKVFPGSQGVKSSTSTSTASNPALRKSARRSSIGTAEARANSGLPQPRNPSRPVSVSVLEGTPPPPVPRIPSMHLRESKRGHEQLDRRRSLLHR